MQTRRRGTKKTFRGLGERKGIETIVAWVLLLGFSVTLGVMVMMWATKTTEKMTEKTLSYMEGSLQCGDVQIYAVFSQPTGPPGTTQCGYMNITNRGYITIDEIAVRGINKGNKATFSTKLTSAPWAPLQPKTEARGTTSGWGIPNNNAEVDLIPVVYIDSKKYGCTEKLVRLTC